MLKLKVDQGPDLLKEGVSAKSGAGKGKKRAVGNHGDEIDRKLKEIRGKILENGERKKERKKGGSIVLVDELEKEKEMNIEAVESTSKVYENKGKGLVAENEDSVSQDDINDIDEHLAFISRRFSKLKFKKKFGAAKPNRNMVDKSKFKCFKCGLAGHFASECRKSDSSKKKFEPVDYC
ncbi:hypothetical protein AgCh_012359 [Apium graveolens]